MSWSDDPGLPAPGRPGVLLIGSSSAIGRAIGQRLSSRGDTVIGVDPVPVQDGGLTAHVVADCSTVSGCELAVARSVELMGRLDTLVLGAAVMPFATIEQTTDHAWRQAIDTSLTGAFYLCRSAVRHLPRGGSIVGISSINSRISVPGVSAYAAAKAGLDGLIRQLAVELGPRGIRVNAVNPGRILPTEARDDGVPLGRSGLPDEVAAAVDFLSGADASYVSGACLPVDGAVSVVSPAAFLRPEFKTLMGEGRGNLSDVRSKG